MLVLPVLLLMSCGTNGVGISKPPVVKVIDTACSWTNYIYISKDDVLTDGTARQILAYNETRQENCDGKGTGADPANGG